MVDFNARNWAGPSGLRDRLSVLIDPRQRRGIRFPLEEILLLAMAAVLAGKRSYIAILRAGQIWRFEAKAGGPSTPC